MRRRASFGIPAGALLLAAVTALPASAQLARPRVASPDAPKLLVAPFARDNADSALSLLIADGARDRVRVQHLDKFNLITRQALNTVLTESGFPVDIPIEPTHLRQIIRFMNVKYLIEGSMIRKPGDSVLIVARLSEATGTTPQAVTMSMMMPAGRLNSGTGAEIANRLVAGYAAFDEVAACRREVEAGNIPRAEQMATRALQQSAANAGAWLCRAQIREAQNAPEDSVIGALRMAYERDTLATAVMRRLATKYQARNDTTRLLEMLKRILTIDFRDNELRTSTAQLMVRMGQPDSAVAVVNQGLRENPASVELLGVKAVAMAAGAHWDSAYTTLQTLSEIDTSKVDSLFIYRITNYALQKPDSAAWLTWVEKATQKFPTQLTYWYTLASQRMVRGDSAGAEAAARGLLANVPPGDQSAATKALVARGEYVVAMLLNGHGQVDSALVHADRAVALDTSITGNVAVVFLQAGARARGLSVTDSTQQGAAGDSVRAAHLDRAVNLLQRSVTMSAGNTRLLQQASFQLGVAQFTKGIALDKQAETTRSCDPVRLLGPLWDAVNTNMAAGARTNVQIANQILTAVPQFQGRAAAFARNFRCN